MSFSLTMAQLKTPIVNAPNFTLWELTRSAAAERLHLDNMPTEAATTNLIILAQHALQPCRDALGVTLINSAYRAPLVNKAVGGSPTSWHEKGCAADLTVRGVPLWDVFTWFYKNIPCVELIAEELPNGWIHAAYSKSYDGPCATKYKLSGHPVRRATFEEIEKIFKQQGLI